MGAGRRRFASIPVVAVGATLGGLAVTTLAALLLVPRMPERVTVHVGAAGPDRIIARHNAVVEAFALFALPVACAGAAIVADRIASRRHQDMRGTARGVAVMFASLAVVLAVVLTVTGIGYFTNALGGI